MTVHLGLACQSNREVLARLAERLPSSALGFQALGANRAQTAGEFRSEGPTDLATFSGNLTDHFSANEAIALVQELLECRSQAIRSTVFNLTLDNIEWAGASSGQAFAGSLRLSDLKPFKRVERFSISARLQLPGNEPRSPEVRGLLKQLAAATGIPFDKGMVRRDPGDYGSPARGNKVLLGQICFDETIEDCLVQLPWRGTFAANAHSPHAAFERRFEEWRAKPPTKVNLPGIVKRSIREFLPAFRFDSVDGDEIVFRKQLSGECDVLVAFEKELIRLGKAFTLRLGVIAREAMIRWETHVFELARSAEPRIWIYSDESEAKSVVDEAVALAIHLLPTFESSARNCFAAWPTELPSGVQNHGNPTAREAFEKAESLAMSSFPDAKLIRLFYVPRARLSLDIDPSEWELMLNGRLGRGGAWWFHFYSSEHDTSFEITLPAVGRMRLREHGGQYKTEGGRLYLIPMEGAWIDSSRAIALAEERGGRERRNSGKLCGISPKLQMSRAGRPYWAFLYAVLDARGRNDLIVNLDAVTGEPITHIYGF